MLERLPGLGGWDRDPLWATVYDWLIEHPIVGAPVWRFGMGSELQRLYDTAARIAEVPAGGAILDIPCGGGVALRGLAPGQGVRYVAADISEKMLDRTREAAAERGLLDQVELRQADVGDLPFADGEFDLVVSFTGLHCFPDPRQALLEMGRVTRPGGEILGSTLLNKAELRGDLALQMGRISGVIGPGVTLDQVRGGLDEAGYVESRVDLSGPMAYFSGRRS